MHNPSHQCNTDEMLRRDIANQNNAAARAQLQEDSENPMTAGEALAPGSSLLMGSAVPKEADPSALNLRDNAENNAAIANVKDILQISENQAKILLRSIFTISRNVL